jgi:hypothetical protein
MPKMQAAQLGYHQGPGSAATAVPARLLEDSDGVTRLYFCDEVVAVTRGHVAALDCSFGDVDWLQWSVERLDWCRPAALKLLQGASLQQLFGPRYIIVRGASSPLYDPCPRMEHVELAELVNARKSLTRQGFFELIHKAHDSLPPRA